MPKWARYLFIVLALFGLGFAIWTGIPGRPRAAEEGAAPQAVAPESATDREDSPPHAELDGERIETASELGAQNSESLATASAPPAGSEDANTNVAKLTARFVDALGNPWPGVLLHDSQRVQVSATSDANGDVTLDVPMQGPAILWTGKFVARRVGCATKILKCTLTAAAATSLGDVVLGPGIDIHGRVVDERGHGIKARVGVVAGEIEVRDEGQVRRQGVPQFERGLAVESMDDGAFLIHGVSPGEWRIWGRGGDTRFGWSDEFTLVEGADARGFEIVAPALLETDLITGIVLNREGQPVPNAPYSYTYPRENTTRTVSARCGAEGRFRFVVDREDVTYELTAGDPENRRAEVAVRGVRPGARDVELRLGANEPLYLILRGPEGEPIEQCKLLIVRETSKGRWAGIGKELKSDGGGRFELVAPTTRFRLEIEVDGYRRHKTDELEPRAPGSTLEFQLSRPEFLRGRVQAGGRPASGVMVRAFKDVGDATLVVNGFRSRHNSRREAEARTDADGNFALPCNDGDLLWIRAELAGYAASEIGPVNPAERRVLELSLAQGGAIEGVVLLPGGADATGTIVGISCGDGFGQTQRAGAGGRFRFDGLTPGPWQVLRRDEEVTVGTGSSQQSDPSGPIEWNCEVRDGRTTRFDLDLSRP